METNRNEYENEFNKFASRFGTIFANESGFRNMQKYLKGLIGTAERKNGWQMAEYLGETTPYSIQQFLYRGRFSADELRDELRRYVKDNIGEKDGILVVDETGFLKQGKMSCGVQRQYSGTAGRIENCQIGVLLAYASSKGHSLIDRRLYMPKEWMDDTERCKKAGVPESVKFQTKPQMALEMIQGATTANMEYTWVTGDCVYGDYSEIRMWLERNLKCYVMGVSGKAYVWMGHEQASIASIHKNLPKEGWFEASCGDGSKGERLYDWLLLPMNPGNVEGYKRSLLIRRSKTDPEDLRSYICFAPTDTQSQKLVKVAGSRWTVETCFKETKSEVGMDQYEVRSYDGWYKHITFACMAIALITVLSSLSFDTKTMQEYNPATSSLEEFKKKRNLLV
jgi:SRSO17 transposase